MTTSITTAPAMKLARLQILPRLNAAVDWFIPARLKRSGEVLQGARMFMFSHFFGPFLGHTISLSMLWFDGRADLSWWVFFGAVSAFWAYPLALRTTGLYVPLALLSVENLLFCIFWGCYQYGGIASPIMPWLVTVPLLAFFYLPERSTRISVSLLIVLNLGLFFGIYSTVGFQYRAADHGLVLLGLVSTLCASLYVSMMALYFAKISTSQGELEHEIHRHLSTQKMLRDATSQAQRALVAKSEFLAKMSHELKNPLNAIIGYSEILIEDAGSEQTQKWKDLTSIRSAGHKLLSLIDALLELSKLEAGKVTVRAERFEFAEFFEDWIARNRPSIAAGANELLLQPVPAGAMTCDRDKLRRVLDGLLDNAAKFTRNGRITVAATLRDGAWCISIADSGAGIEPARIDTLFETFGSAEGETASRYADEVRLGLPLAYRYCRLLGGTLSVRSEAGAGSTATVTLPAHARGADEHSGPALQLQPHAA